MVDMAERTGTEDAEAPVAFDFVIVGGTGDLTMRKLLPAFYQRYRLGQIEDSTRLIGVARSDLSTAAYRERASAALREFVSRDTYDDQKASAFLELVHYVSLDMSDRDADWEELAAHFQGGKADRPRVFYVATAPRLYVPTADAIAHNGLITPATRLVLEKPIGTDTASACAINDGVGHHFTERQIFRIDHYLGKPMVQNILALRFANPILERSWNAEGIAHVQITALETVGVGKRGAYYDTAGALRDMVQNHLLQVLSLIAMEPPAALSETALRDGKLKILHALAPMTPASVAQDTVRAQYTAGEIAGEKVGGYLEDLGRTDSQTETFLALRAEVQTPRWVGVPFYLRTGKRAARKETEVVITFRAPLQALFEAQADRLVIRIQPDEGVSLSLASKDPAQRFGLRDAMLDVSYSAAFNTRYPDAYEDLLMAAVRGDQVLFIRRDEVEAAWRWIEPILQGWAADVRPMEFYPAGSWGPDSSDELLAREGFRWEEKV